MLEYKKRNKIFSSCVKLIGIYLDIREAFKSKHQRIVKKIKHHAHENLNVLDRIIKDIIIPSSKIFQ